MAHPTEYLTLIIVFLFLQGQINGQDTDHPSFSIEYVEQYSLAEDGNKSWISELILGKKENFLLKPVSVSAIQKDDFWVADQERGTLYRYNEGKVDLLPLSKLKLDPFPSLVATCSLPDGKLAFTDSRLNRIYIYDPQEKELIVLNDSLILVRPTGIAYSALRDEFWVAETGKHNLVALDSDGKLLKRVGKRGKGPGEFNYPTHLCLDMEGNILVVDAMNYRIQVFDPGGRFLSMFGEQGDASGYLARPKGIYTDSYGHIYVADALFHVVQVFDREGLYLYAIGSQGSGEGQFWMPTGICINRDNHIFVSDTYNKRIQVFQLIETEMEIK